MGGWLAAASKVAVGGAPTPSVPPVHAAPCALLALGRGPGGLSRHHLAARHRQHHHQATSAELGGNVGRLTGPLWSARVLGCRSGRALSPRGRRGAPPPWRGRERSSQR